MKQLLSTAIVLTRTDYGEADRIVTLLTPEQGKLRLMARGVRKIKSRLAGAIELFSVSEIGYIHGRGELGTLISARLIRHYGNIVKDIERVQLGYELIKTLHKATEDQPEPAYFALLEQGFAALDDVAISTELIGLWFQAQLLAQAGLMPNLLTDTTGAKLAAGQTYDFDIEAVGFAVKSNGQFTADHIKTLRLLFGGNKLTTLNQVLGIHAVLPDLISLLQLLTSSYIVRK